MKFAFVALLALVGLCAIWQSAEGRRPAHGNAIRYFYKTGHERTRSKVKVVRNARICARLCLHRKGCSGFAFQRRGRSGRCVFYSRRHRFSRMLSRNYVLYLKGKGPCKKGGKKLPNPLRHFRHYAHKRWTGRFVVRKGTKKHCARWCLRNRRCRAFSQHGRYFCRMYTHGQGRKLRAIGTRLYVKKGHGGRKGPNALRQFKKFNHRSMTGRTVFRGAGRRRCANLCFKNRKCRGFAYKRGRCYMFNYGLGHKFRKLGYTLYLRKKPIGRHVGKPKFRHFTRLRHRRWSTRYRSYRVGSRKCHRLCRLNKRCRAFAIRGRRLCFLYIYRRGRNLAGRPYTLYVKRRRTSCGFRKLWRRFRRFNHRRSTGKYITRKGNARQCAIRCYRSKKCRGFAAYRGKRCHMYMGGRGRKLRAKYVTLFLKKGYKGPRKGGNYLKKFRRFHHRRWLKRSRHVGRRSPNACARMCIVNKRCKGFATRLGHCWMYIYGKGRKVLSLLFTLYTKKGHKGKTGGALLRGFRRYKQTRFRAGARYVGLRNTKHCAKYCLRFRHKCKGFATYGRRCYVYTGRYGRRRFRDRRFTLWVRKRRGPKGRGVLRPYRKYNNRRLTATNVFRRASRNACAVKCKKNKKCKGFAWKRGRCYMYKYGRGKKVKARGYTLYLKKGRRPKPKPKTLVIRGFKLYKKRKYHYGHLGRGWKTLKQCYTGCHRTRWCKGFLTMAVGRRKKLLCWWYKYGRKTGAIVRHGRFNLYVRVRRKDVKKAVKKHPVSKGFKRLPGKYMRIRTRYYGKHSTRQCAQRCLKTKRCKGFLQYHKHHKQCWLYVYGKGPVRKTNRHYTLFIKAGKPKVIVKPKPKPGRGSGLWKRFRKFPNRRMSGKYSFRRATPYKCAKACYRNRLCRGFSHRLGRCYLHTHGRGRKIKGWGYTLWLKKRRGTKGRFLIKRFKKFPHRRWTGKFILRRAGRNRCAKMALRSKGFRGFAYRRGRCHLYKYGAGRKIRARSYVLYLKKKRGGRVNLGLLKRYKKFPRKRLTGSFRQMKKRPGRRNCAKQCFRNRRCRGFAVRGRKCFLYLHGRGHKINAKGYILYLKRSRKWRGLFRRFTRIKNRRLTAKYRAVRTKGGRNCAKMCFRNRRCGGFSVKGRKCYVYLHGRGKQIKAKGYFLYLKKGHKWRGVLRRYNKYPNRRLTGKARLIPRANRIKCAKMCFRNRRCGGFSQRRHHCFLYTHGRGRKIKARGFTLYTKRGRKWKGPVKEFRKFAGRRLKVRARLLKKAGRRKCAKICFRNRKCNGFATRGRFCYLYVFGRGRKLKAKGFYLYLKKKWKGRLNNSLLKKYLRYPNKRMVVRHHLVRRTSARKCAKICYRKRRCNGFASRGRNCYMYLYGRGRKLFTRGTTMYLKNLRRWKSLFARFKKSHWPKKHGKFVIFKKTGLRVCAKKCFGHRRCKGFAVRRGRCFLRIKGRGKKIKAKGLRYYKKKTTKPTGKRLLKFYKKVNNRRLSSKVKPIKAKSKKCAKLCFRNRRCRGFAVKRGKCYLYTKGKGRKVKAKGFRLYLKKRRRGWRRLAKRFRRFPHRRQFGKIRLLKTTRMRCAKYCYSKRKCNAFAFRGRKCLLYMKKRGRKIPSRGFTLYQKKKWRGRVVPGLLRRFRRYPKRRWTTRPRVVKNSSPRRCANLCFKNRRCNAFATRRRLCYLYTKGWGRKLKARGYNLYVRKTRSWRRLLKRYRKFNNRLMVGKFRLLVKANRRQCAKRCYRKKKCNGFGYRKGRCHLYTFGRGRKIRAKGFKLYLKKNFKKRGLIRQFKKFPNKSLTGRYKLVKKTTRRRCGKLCFRNRKCNGFALRKRKCYLYNYGRGRKIPAAGYVLFLKKTRRWKGLLRWYKRYPQRRMSSRARLIRRYGRTKCAKTCLRNKRCLAFSMRGRNCYQHIYGRGRVLRNRGQNLYIKRNKGWRGLFGRFKRYPHHRLTSKYRLVKKASRNRCAKLCFRNKRCNGFSIRRRVCYLYTHGRGRKVRSWGYYLFLKRGRYTNRGGLFKRFKRYPHKRMKARAVLRKAGRRKCAKLCFRNRRCRAFGTRGRKCYLYTKGTGRKIRAVNFFLYVRKNKRGLKKLLKRFRRFPNRRLLSRARYFRKSSRMKCAKLCFRNRRCHGFNMLGTKCWLYARGPRGRKVPARGHTLYLKKRRTWKGVFKGFRKYNHRRWTGKVVYRKTGSRRCARMCKRNRKCRAFAVKSGRCYLYNYGRGRKVRSWGSYLFVKRSQRWSHLFRNYRRYRHKKLTGKFITRRTGSRNCAKMCMRNKSCKGFSHKHGRCFLYTHRRGRRVKAWGYNLYMKRGSAWKGLLKNFRYFKNRRLTGSFTSKRTAPRQCAKMCMRNRRCGGFSHKRGICYLYTHGPGKRIKAWGYRLYMRKGHKWKGLFRNFRKYNHRRMKGKFLPKKAGRSHCAKMCIKNRKCKGFAHKGRHCFLYTKKGRLFKAYGYSLFLRRGRKWKGLFKNFRRFPQRRLTAKFSKKRASPSRCAKMCMKNRRCRGFGHKRGICYLYRGKGRKTKAWGYNLYLKTTYKWRGLFSNYRKFNHRRLSGKKIAKRASRRKCSKMCIRNKKCLGFAHKGVTCHMYTGRGHKVKAWGFKLFLKKNRKWRGLFKNFKKSAHRKLTGKVVTKRAGYRRCAKMCMRSKTCKGFARKGVKCFMYTGKKPRKVKAWGYTLFQKKVKKWRHMFRNFKAYQHKRMTGKVLRRKTGIRNCAKLCMKNQGCKAFAHKNGRCSVYSGRKGRKVKAWGSYLYVRKTPRWQGLFRNYRRFKHRRLTARFIVRKAGARHCAKSCMKNRKCRGFSYKFGRCYLYTKNKGKRVKSWGYLLYLKRGRKWRGLFKNYKGYKNRRWKGRFVKKRAGRSHCAKMCMRNRRCKAFAHKRGLCFLYTRRGRKSRAWGYYLYVKKTPKWRGLKRNFRTYNHRKLTGKVRTIKRGGTRKCAKLCMRNKKCRGFARRGRKCFMYTHGRGKKVRAWKYKLFLKKTYKWRGLFKNYKHYKHRKLTGRFASKKAGSRTCAKMCMRNRRCKGFSHKRGMCYLYTHAKGRKTKAWGYNLYMKTTYKWRGLLKGFRTFKHRRWTGKSIFKRASRRNCAKMCMRNKKCKGFSRKGGRCYLYVHGMGRKLRAWGYVLYLKKGIKAKGLAFRGFKSYKHRRMTGKFALKRIGRAKCAKTCHRSRRCKGFAHKRGKCYIYRYGRGRRIRAWGYHLFLKKSLRWRRLFTNFNRYPQKRLSGKFVYKRAGRRRCAKMCMRNQKCSAFASKGGKCYLYVYGGGHKIKARGWNLYTKRKHECRGLFRNFRGIYHSRLSAKYVFKRAGQRRCAKFCLRNGRCKAFAYKRGKCYMYTHGRGRRIHARGYFLYLKRHRGWRGLFRRYRKSNNRRLTGKRVVQKFNKRKCAKMCRRNRRCKGFAIWKKRCHMYLTRGRKVKANGSTLYQKKSRGQRHLFRNFKIFHHRFLTGQFILKRTSHRNCAKMCMRSRTCKGFAQKHSKCYLYHHGLGKMIKARGFFLYMKKKHHQKLKTMLKRFKNFGHRLVTGIFSLKTVRRRACARLCKKNRKCKGFAYKRGKCFIYKHGKTSKKIRTKRFRMFLKNKAKTSFRRLSNRRFIGKFARVKRGTAKQCAAYCIKSRKCKGFNRIRGKCYFYSHGKGKFRHAKGYNAFIKKVNPAVKKCAHGCRRRCAKKYCLRHCYRGCRSAGKKGKKGHKKRHRSPRRKRISKLQRVRRSCIKKCHRGLLGVICRGVCNHKYHVARLIQARKRRRCFHACKPDKEGFLCRERCHRVFHG